MNFIWCIITMHTLTVSTVSTSERTEVRKARREALQRFEAESRRKGNGHKTVHPLFIEEWEWEGAYGEFGCSVGKIFYEATVSRMRHKNDDGCGVRIGFGTSKAT